MKAISPPPTSMLRMVALTLSLVAAACGEVDQDERVREAEQPMVYYRDVNLVSPNVPGGGPETPASHTVSVAVSDGIPNTSDVVVAYERNGESWRSWGSLTCCASGGSINWTRAGGGMPSPANGPTDSFAFGKYEGWPSVLSFQYDQGGSNPLNRTFLYVTKFGSTVNGSTVTSGSGGRFSTDVAVLRSSDGGVTFGNGQRLTSPPPSGTARWKIEFPVASNRWYTSTFADGWIVVAWKQTPILTSGQEGTPSWKMRYVRGDYNVDPLNYIVPPLSSDPWTLPIVGGANSGPISITASGPAPWTVRYAYPNVNTMQLEADGVTWKANSRCPNPSATFVDNTWIYGTTVCDKSGNNYVCSAAVEENIDRDPQWRICVGASRPANGTVYNKQLIQPRMAIDPVSGNAYVAVTGNFGNAATRSKVRIYEKAGSAAFAQIFQSADSTDGIQHDDWAPVLGVYHYPAVGETNHIFLSWRTTFYDTLSPTRNERINRVATQKNGAAAWDAVAFALDHQPTAVAVQGWLGAYDGAFGAPYVGNPLPTNNQAFSAAWGDPRVPTSHVYGSTELSP